MKFFKKYAGLAALLAAVTVQAQPPPPAPKAVPPSEMRVRVEQMKKDIEAEHRHVLHLQAVVRKNKDVIKLTCVNDKLVLLKAQMNLFDTSSLQLEAAINNTDDSPRTIFADIEQVNAEVKRLRTEADGCAGELEMYKQESATDVVRPELPDPTVGQPFNDSDQLGVPEIDPPAYATPFS